MIEMMKVAMEALLQHVLVKFNLAGNKFIPVKYKSEMILNSDFKKFDDILRMVVDCDVAQAERIENLLKFYEQQGELIYSIHQSSKALMTCLVYSYSDNKHMHFIDGADGGYTSAAAVLKNKKMP